MQWIDKIPTKLLVILAIFMGVAPITPEPHLVQKLKMLMTGTLVKPIDIFDLFWHLLPAILLAIKLRRAKD